MVKASDIGVLCRYLRRRLHLPSGARLADIDAVGVRAALKSAAISSGCRNERYGLLRRVARRPAPRAIKYDAECSRSRRRHRCCGHISPNDPSRCDGRHGPSGELGCHMESDIRKKHRRTDATDAATTVAVGRSFARARCRLWSHHGRRRDGCFSRGNQSTRYSPWSRQHRPLLPCVHPNEAVQRIQHVGGSCRQSAPASNGIRSCDGPSVRPRAWLMAATLYFWQFPHFFSLAWLHRNDYAKGLHRMVPCEDPGGKWTAAIMMRHTAGLSLVPAAAYALDVTSSMFLVDATLLNAVLAYKTSRFHQNASDGEARKIFLCSLWYLPAFLGLMIIHKRKWLTDADMASLKESEFYLLANQVIEGTRSGLRGACVHEAAVVPEDSTSSPSLGSRRASTKSMCPVAVFEDKKGVVSKPATSQLARCDGANGSVTAYQSGEGEGP